MEDWQGCLHPHCQRALVSARESVEARHGRVVTVEDFLLALFDTCPTLNRYLAASGVDLDELTRTVQCEQPIVTEVAGEDFLSSQLISWLAAARQVCEGPWLDWPVLLEVLTHRVERLREKAYVAVLELVAVWPSAPVESLLLPTDNQSEIPVVVADVSWQQLAEDVAVALSVNTRALVWVRGGRGAGKSSWLLSLLATPELDYVEMDLRRESETLTANYPVVPDRIGKLEQPWPILVLDDMSPADLVALLSRPESLASELVPAWDGSVLLVGDERDLDACQLLEHWLGRAAVIVDFPESSGFQRRAILVAHQASIEKRWQVELPPAVVQFAANCRDPRVATPGAMLHWVNQAAARLYWLVRRGPAELLALDGRLESLCRESLVGLAREKATGSLELSVQELEGQRDVAEATWRRRYESGLLHRLSVDDLRHELAHWVAARPGQVHYVPNCNDQDGDASGAGSGNLRS